MSYERCKQLPDFLDIIDIFKKKNKKLKQQPFGQRRRVLVRYTYLHRYFEIIFLCFLLEPKKMISKYLLNCKSNKNYLRLSSGDGWSTEKWKNRMSLLPVTENNPIKLLDPKVPPFFNIYFFTEKTLFHLSLNAYNAN